jgi:protein subunit release factor A
VDQENIQLVTTMSEKDEEDYGALIYRESQLRKAEAEAAAAKSTKKRKKNSSTDASSTRRTYNCRTTRHTLRFLMTSFTDKIKVRSRYDR